MVQNFELNQVENLVFNLTIKHIKVIKRYTLIL